MESRADDEFGQRALAGCLGAPAALLRRTAFHGLIDALAALLPNGGTVLVDEAAYPVSRWAAAVATLHGARVVTFRHHDVSSAAETVRHATGPFAMLTDGWCGSCSLPAPLLELAELARRISGHLLVDDSLAIGVLGSGAHSSCTFGEGGGGVRLWLGGGGERTTVVASLAKAWGVPLAVVAGDAPVINEIVRNGPTGIHASGPTAADRAALRAALATPTAAVNRRRRHLCELTLDLRRRLRGLGLDPVGLPFPLTIVDVPGDPVAVLAGLQQAGIRALLLDPRCRRRPHRAVLAFALRSDHTAVDLSALACGVARTLNRERRTVA